MLDVEKEARWILRGLDPVPAARAIVRARLGDIPVMYRRLPGGDACSVTRSSGREIWVRPGTVGVRLRWALLHEVAENHLDDIGYEASDIEQTCERLAAALAMPRAPYIRETWQTRMSLPELADLFAVTQTAAALRLAEASLLAGVAVVHPRFRMQRGHVPDDARVIRRPVTDAPLRQAHLAP